ncbi:hypothetical protein F0L74_06065 [Chitinophaga agrisoli]|uniref:Integrase catalytic domain-containing protein n=1 Tax=Chitinophaga agrisoli TaxID=2607653 RepID=A0A5B2W4A4_9BACT|nr:hypothetical protein [Chitinophaga agrisoli]KAA2245522.1 hypothetical protein F0L74_06065 [Chitinophaga agrisoli]
MKLIDNILYMELPELVECGIKENTIWHASSRKSPSWQIIDDPADRRKVLIGYEKLKDQYKDMVIARYGNPYEHMAKQPIRDMVTKDLKAEAVFLAYRYGPNKDNSLPTGTQAKVDYVKRYTTAASWLNMLVKAAEDKKAIKKAVNLNIEQFYLHVLEIIKRDQIDLPSNYQALLRRRREYQEKGYECLIDWRFGNKNAAKVDNEVSSSLLLTLVSNANQYDDVYVCMRYNEWAVQNGHSPITSRTVCNWRQDNEHLILSTREGQAPWYDKYGKEVKGYRPSAPLYLVESDDNHLDLLFIDEETGNAFSKYKAIVVTDSYNDYVLGYAYTSGEITVELVQAAYLNAMHHLRELTGGWYLPHEVKTDRWGIKRLEPFYESMGNYFRTPVGSKRRGFLEQFFGSPLWKNSLKAGANNYSGNNMVAKTRGVNVEELALNRKERPTLTEGRTQVENFFHRLRHTPDNKTGITKQQQWLNAFAAMPDADKKAINDEQFLLTFGVQHLPQGRTVAITKGGVEPMIQGVQYGFIVPPDLYLQNVGRQVTVIYDPYDMSRVLCTDFASLRFLASSDRRGPRALADFQVGNRTALNSFLAEKREDTRKVAEAADRRREILRRNGVDAEAMLQGGVMVKELKQAAEERYLQQTTERRGDYNPFELM